jgi:hypothetical protein
VQQCIAQKQQTIANLKELARLAERDLDPHERERVHALEVRVGILKQWVRRVKEGKEPEPTESERLLDELSTAWTSLNAAWESDDKEAARRGEERVRGLLNAAKKIPAELR